MSSPTPLPASVGLKPWDQLPGEPALWYGRFCLYRDLGPGRTLTGASRVERKAKNKRSWPPNESWYRAAEAWRWRERALAWDAHQRNLLTLCEYNIRLAARDRRVAITEEGIDLAREGLELADLPGMTMEQARKAFPQLRRFLTDMLKAQRKEFEIPIAEDDTLTRPITADDLRSAMRELERQEQELWADPPPAAGRAAAAAPAASSVDSSPAAGAPPSPRRPKDTRLRLFVCPALGDPAGPLDPAVMRALGLRICRVVEADRTKFCEAFARERTLRRPIELLHVGLRTTAAGIEFSNGPTRSGWRMGHGERLRIVLLARHAGPAYAGPTDAGPADAGPDYAGPGLSPQDGARRPAWCAAVPHLVTLGEDMPAAAARTFAVTFWQAVAGGQPPAAALAAALDAIAPAARKYVSAHLAAPTGGLVDDGLVDEGLVDEGLADEGLAGNSASDAVDVAYNR